ncbi:uncharacterized protein LOC132608858 [Lycium barbarum]|uniref:uncharacterized protein LOC132608858 n=1 Tax=Lycium barbarum TaxID=112863 RepID=UPI00293E264B|nr:uncharacterized protein LOC132608858 [Lycium barbarum]
MEKIQHKNVSVNGIKMHVAEIGEGPAVLFLHGFPELWYSWRHQMLYLSNKGYRAIAPDLRGYGDTDCPTDISSYTAFHIVGDLVALLDVLGLEQVFLVGHDWGAIIAWYFCLFRPDRIKALVNLSVVFNPRNPLRKPVDSLRELFGDDYYMCRFQEPGKVEEEFASADTAKLIKGFLSSRSLRPPCVPKEIGFQVIAQSPETLPSWITEEDVHYYAEKLKKTGFTGGLNYYRNLDRNWELTAPFSGCKIQVPTKFVVGDLDLTYHVPGTKEYIHNGGFKKDVPNLEEVVVMEGVAHFINQERADEISAHIYDFIQRF